MRSSKLKASIYLAFALWVLLFFALWQHLGIVPALVVAVVLWLIGRVVLVGLEQREAEQVRTAEHDKAWIEIQLPQGETDSREKMRRALRKLALTTNKLVAERRAGRGSIQIGYNVIPQYDDHGQKVNLLSYTVTCDREHVRDVSRAYRSQYPDAFIFTLRENPLAALETAALSEIGQRREFVPDDYQDELDEREAKRQERETKRLRKLGLPEPLVS